MNFGSLAVLAIVCLVAVQAVRFAKQYLQIVECGNQLATINQATRVWADAHDGRLPAGLAVLSNLLTTPRLLICPGDESRDPAESWQAVASANSSYQMRELPVLPKDFPHELLQYNRYLQCKIHWGNYVNALGEVCVSSRPAPVSMGLFLTLATVAFLGSWWLTRHIERQNEPPLTTTAQKLMPRIEQVRQDHLAARGLTPDSWYRKTVLAATRHAVRVLAFFTDRGNKSPGAEKPMS